MEQLNRDMILQWLPNRPKDGHKGTFGRVLILGGSVGFTGAPVLAANAAVRGGTGLVFLGVPRAIWQIAAVKCTEAMPFPLEDDDGRCDEDAFETIEPKLDQVDAVLIGPGLGRSKELDQLVCRLLKRCRVPMVVDADGLNALSQHMDVLFSCQAPMIFTPHDGEYQRLTGHLPGEDRAAEASSFAAGHGVVMVLKGHRTIVASPDGRVWQNTTGNHGMAKGGSGDVLAGLIVSLLGQGMCPEEAAAAAVWIHGRAGDLAAEQYGFRGMLPSDLIEMLPRVWKDDLQS